jgi:hypothetical protein
LIFDDLERRKIDISNILGYINFFVEHQGLKAILIANEDELIIHDRYNQIKEKLIGKTFCILPDFNNALSSFVESLSNEELKKFLRDNTQLIHDLYVRSQYENLRNLKQIILEFGRLFDRLPEKAQNKSKFLQDILQILMAFSIEIKRGNMLTEDINPSC